MAEIPDKYKMNCPDPEGCRHFKKSIRLQDQLNNQHAKVAKLLSQRAARAGQVKVLRDILLEILNCAHDDECETAHGLRETYHFVPRSLLDKAMKLLEG